MSAGIGPIESQPWPDALEAFAVDASSSPRLFGYDVDEDLAVHYRFTDLVLLAFTGELPDDRRSRAFEIALCSLVPASVARAPIHAAVLAAHCGARPGGVLGAATVACADETTRALETLRTIFDQPPSVLPDELRAGSDVEARYVERLRARISELVDVPLLALGPRREVALLAVLWACGVKSSLSLASALVIARMPVAVAEALPRVAGDFSRYPTNEPPFEYQE